MPRPSKYTPERAAKVIAGLRAGMTRTAACGQAGVCYDTFLSWGRRKVGFWAEVGQAEAEAEARFTEVLAKAAFGHEVIKTRRTTPRPTE